MKNWKDELDKKIMNIIDSEWMCCDKDGDGCDCYEKSLKTKTEAINKIIQSLLSDFAKEMIGEEIKTFASLEFEKENKWSEHFRKGYQTKSQELIKIAKKWGVKI